MINARTLRLCLLYGLVCVSLLTPQPARAQTELLCSAETPTVAVEAEQILACLRAGMDVNLNNVTVTGTLDLTTLISDGQTPAIANTLIISNSQLTDGLSAFDANTGITLAFLKQVDLRGSQIKGTVDFTGAVFDEFAHFENSRFEADANFTQVVFQNGASFSGAVFSNSATFLLAQNFGALDFLEAQFSGAANFALAQSSQHADASIPSDVSFSGASFTGAVYFMNATFENAVYFSDVVFQRAKPDDLVDLSNATFSTLNLSGAVFESGQLNINGMRYEKLVMPTFQPKILTPLSAEETITALKKNFSDDGELGIANEIAYWQNSNQHQNSHPIVRFLDRLFFDWTFGYGFKPFNALRTSVILILLFSIRYYPEGVLRPAAFAPSKPRERKLTIRLSELPIAHEDEPADSTGKIQHRLPLPPQVMRAWRALVFSFGVFTKFSSGSYVAVGVNAWVVAEWVIGLMMIAGFLFTLANTNPLLRLVLDAVK